MEPVEVYMGNFHGEVYEFEESGMKGICVVDDSGTVHPTSKTLLVKSATKVDNVDSSSLKFTLKQPTTIDKFYGENDISPVLKIEFVKIHLSQFVGEVREYTENGTKGLCVIDRNGNMYPASKITLSKA
jgi:pyruvate/oxaloacetate carboxyltransferase